MPELYDQLASVFGFRSFRPHQEAVVRAILAGRDTFTIMPTGGGKSLCYQLPARLRKGVCVVISPLISLMKDQVDAANATGMASAAFNSACSGADKNAISRALHERALDMLYVSPERIRLPDFQALLKSLDIAFFAIDEAHCISEWGHDFRPDYLALETLADAFPGVPLAAFTATATHRVAKDIIARLRLRDPLLTRASFNRSNLFYQVTPKEKLEAQILDFVREREGESGIIYRTTRKNVEATTAFLRRNRIAAKAYHAGLADEERKAAQDAFRKDSCPVMVATVAFGMGIDKSNVRYVVHGDLPKNLESYYQETGRAGRDGEPARCALFYGRGDIAQLMRFAENIEDEEAREAAKTQLYRMLDFTQKEGCRRKSLLAYFGEDLPGDNCGGCDICTGEAEREDATVGAQKLLSAMVRTGNRFGAGHLIAVVMGKDTKRVRDCGHNALPTYGVGNDKNAAYWHRVMDALLAQGMAYVADPALPVPAVTQEGWKVLRGERGCSIVRLAETRKKSASARLESNSPLFSILREERLRLAGESGASPYVIFSDRSLREMAVRLPDTPARLLAINGVGQHKLAAYGESFLALIREWLEKNPDLSPADDQEGAKNPDISQNSSIIKTSRGDTWRETGRLLDSGLDLEEAARERGVKVATVINHLEKLLQNGKVYSPYRFIEPHRLEYIGRLFKATGGWRLAPVVEASRAGARDEQGRDMEGTAYECEVGYEEARLARLLLCDHAADNE